MIKNSFKFIVLIILVIIVNACSSNSNSFWGFKPHFSTGTYIDAYAIMENGKINRMGIPKKDIDKMEEIIYEKYGIRFIDDNQIYADNYIYSAENSNKKYKINFYTDLKMIVNSREYIIPKEKIRKMNNGICFIELPVSITTTNDNEYILDIGEIEITDSEGKVWKSRKKIPPILFKKTIFRRFINDINGNNYDVYYRGWAEDYPKDPNTLKKMYNSIEEIKKSIEKSKKK